MSVLKRLLPALALILAVGACESDTEPENELSMEESVALLTAAGSMLSDTTITPIHVSEDSVVVACPQGGQARLIGAFTEEEGDTARLGVNFQITPTGCGLTGGGLQFTVDGNPNFIYTLTVEIIAATLEFNISGSIVGGLNWALGERSGDCDLALTLEAVPDLVNETLNGVYRGTLCGHEVEIDAADLLVVDL